MAINPIFQNQQVQQTQQQPISFAAAPNNTPVNTGNTTSSFNSSILGALPWMNSNNNSGAGNVSANQQAANLQIDKLNEALPIQQAGFDTAQGRLDAFSGVGQQGIDQAGFLGDPQASFDFLQNNPLFQASLDNANRQTQQSAAAGGRLATGDTLQQLSNNTLLAAQPLLDRQRQDINSQLNFGANLAGQQAGLDVNKAQDTGNILGQIGNTQASGIIGFQDRQDAKRAASKSNKTSLLTGLAGAAAAFFSDERLKKNIVKIGKIGKFNKYSWTWNEKAENLGLLGDSEGVIAQEVESINPDLIIEHKSGYKKVNYGGLV